MEVFEILKGQLYQSGAPPDAADWQPIRDLGIDVVIDLYGTLDAAVPTAPNSILYIFWPIADIPELPDTQIMDVLVDAVVRLIHLGHKVLVHCHMGKSRSGLFNAAVATKILGISGNGGCGSRATAARGRARKSGVCRLLAEPLGSQST